MSFFTHRERDEHVRARRAFKQVDILFRPLFHFQSRQSYKLRAWYLTRRALSAHSNFNHVASKDLGKLQAVKTARVPRLTHDALAGHKTLRKQARVLTQILPARRVCAFPQPKSKTTLRLTHT